MCNVFYGCIWDIWLPSVKENQSKYNKHKESVSLENTNHVETYVLQVNANNINLVCIFWAGLTGSWNVSDTII